MFVFSNELDEWINYLNIKSGKENDAYTETAENEYDENDDDDDDSAYGDDEVNQLKLSHSNKRGFIDEYSEYSINSNASTPISFYTL